MRRKFFKNEALRVEFDFGLIWTACCEVEIFFPKCGVRKKPQFV